MQIVICDDIKTERDTLREHIFSYSCTEVLDYVIDEYENAVRLLDDIKKGKSALTFYLWTFIWMT